MHFTLGENVFSFFLKVKFIGFFLFCFFYAFFGSGKNNLDVVALLVQLSDHFVGPKILHIAVLSMEC